jgi:mannose-1-phosphate guanylyltransferase
MSMEHNYVGIMAGGIGSRFWPESRTHFPKQFLDLLGTGRSLIQWTHDRFKHICPPENIYFITNEQYVATIKSQLPTVADANIISEPSRKNTAACAAYFAHKILALDPKANIIMSPADHLILDERAFEQIALEALRFVATHDCLFTLGISPTRPDTGYGYIQYDTEDRLDNAYKVRTFTEKPSIDLARTFLASGDFLWNSGIFAWNVQSIMTALREFLPELNDVFLQATDVYNTPKEHDTMARLYPHCISTSIDYGIMEKAKNVFVMPANFGWSDLGTWESAYDNAEKDSHNNAVLGSNVMMFDTTNCMIKTKNDKLVVVQGLDKYIVVDTPDVLLICERNKEQHIKEYVAEVKRSKGDKYL